MTTVTVNAKLRWVAQSTSSGKWIGVCEPMNLVMEADSLDELYSVIPETIHTLFTDLVEDNEFDQYLRERGWSAINAPINQNNIEDMHFDVPWELIAAGAHDSARRSC